MLRPPEEVGKLYSYVVARDYGFAPNPFFGVCTLATCKPLIRRRARIGDWIVGTGAKRYGLDGRLVFAMKVAEALSFDAYWSDARFHCKRPNLRGTLKQAFGDNIYHRSRSGRWIQADSHHSLEKGVANPENIKHDTQTDRVLIGTDFVYWGASGPKIPARFRRPDADLCGRRGHRVIEGNLACAFVGWLRDRSEQGYAGDPREFKQQLARC